MKISDFHISEDDANVAYLYLPDHPGEGIFGCVIKTINLSDLIEDYSGPDVHMDFDDKGTLIGIEILA